jgi:hypothetical protein
VSQGFYKQEDKNNGKKYWKKKQYIAQAVIVSDPLPPDENGESHEGKVRYLQLGFQLYNVIKEAFESGELDEVPYAYEGGYDFIIKKSKQGEYSTYSLGSKFRNKSRDLSDEEIAQLDLIDLSTLIPKKPDVDRIERMVNASLTGETYSEDSDHDESAKAVKPVNKAVNKPTNKPVVDEDDGEDDVKPAPRAQQSKPVVQQASNNDDDDELDEVFAQINSRRNKAATK